MAPVSLSFKNEENRSKEEELPTVIFSHGMSLKDIEKSVILETLKRQRFNRTKTAKTLGIGIRTLQRKLKFYREIEGDFIAEFVRS